MLFKNKQSQLSRLKRLDLSKIVVYLAFVVMFIFFAFLLGGKGFLSTGNLLNIVRQTAMISIMAIAMTFVIGSGQIDLSVGSTAALAAVVTASIISLTDSVLLGFFGGVLLGIIVGSLNGLLVTVVRIPAFLTTLATMGIIRGIAMWTTNTAAVPIRNQIYNYIFGSGDVFGVPILLFWTLLFLLCGYVLMNKTAFGKKVLATGGNEIAARFTGVKTDKIKYLTFLMSGVFAAFSGMLYAGRMQTGRYTFGDGDELYVIAAVILGGTSMSGGTGTVLGAVVGSLLMGMIDNGLILAGLRPSEQVIIRGIIIILALALGNKTQKNK